MRSMFAGVSGLRAHQTMMDVVGDNIANVNTAGFKASRVQFADTLSQLVRGGSAPSGENGGINPEQIGLGTRVAAIDMVDTPGALQSTGRPTDVALQGAGYFVVASGAGIMYTRAGSFGFDAGGNLVDPSGMIVQGWLADPATGTVNTASALTGIHVPLDAAIPPMATTEATIGGNLSAGSAAGATAQTSIDVVDGSGTTHQALLTFTRTANPGEWSVTVTGAQVPDPANPGSTIADPAVGAVAPAGATVTFTADGQLATPVPTITFGMTSSGGAASTVTLDLGAPGDPEALSQFGGSSKVSTLRHDGFEMGFLRSFAISDDGTVSGVFSNGQSKALAQLAVATFSNPAGLSKAGQTHFIAGAASGDPVISTAGNGGAGTLAAGSLEMSNVDLAQEFTNLIIAQRGFQANTKVITASDEMLSDVVNLKR